MPKEQIYTIADIYRLPEGQRAELIDGRMYDMAHPGRAHQEALSELHYQIAAYLKHKNGSCKVYPAPFAVFLEEETNTYVEPDISVICDESKLNDKGCSGAPDWVIEIVSPGSRRMDYTVKLFKYRSAGVREYWIVDLEKQRVTVYSLLAEQENMQEFSFSDCVKAGIYEDLTIDFSQIRG